MGDVTCTIVTETVHLCPMGDVTCTIVTETVHLCPMGDVTCTIGTVRDCSPLSTSHALL